MSNFHGIYKSIHVCILDQQHKVYTSEICLTTCIYKYIHICTYTNLRASTAYCIFAAQRPPTYSLLELDSNIRRSRARIVLLRY